MHRRVLIGLLLLVATIGAANLGGTSVQSTSTHQDRATRSADTSDDDSDASPRFFGLTPGLTPANPVERERLFSKWSSGGVRWIRVSLSWQWIETRQGSFVWANHRNGQAPDDIIRAAACQDLAVLPMLFNSPAWATADPSISPSPPDVTHIPQWQNFVRAALARYGRNGSFWKSGQTCANGQPMPVKALKQWEIWNEPNLRAFWGRSPDATEYAALLRASSEAARTSTDPQAKIMVGGLTGDGESSRSANKIEPDMYLRQLYKVPGFSQSFDVIDIHPYAVTPAATIELLQRIRAILDRKNDSRKAVWITEMAWASCLQSGQGYAERCAGAQVTDEAGQAQYLRDVYKGLLRNSGSLNLRRAAWYQWQDTAPGVGSCTWCEGAGLVRRNGTAKPSWESYSRIALKH